MAEASASKLVFPSLLTEAPKVQHAIISRVEALHYSKEAVFAIRLALEEAVVNAINHGNAGDASKQVTVEYRVDDRQTWLRICDEGSGFSPEAVPDPTLEENLTRPHGRGVMLIRAYMDEVRYNPQGNCVTMVKRR